MKKLILGIFLFGIANLCLAQESGPPRSKWIFGFSISPDADRYAQAEKNDLYYQLTSDRHLNEYLVLGAYVGIQTRQSSFTSMYPIPPYTVQEINYERQYIPMGVRFGFDLSTFFSRQLGWIKDESKWEVLLLGYGGLTVMSEDMLTPTHQRDPIEWSDYEMEEDMNYVAGVNTIIRYYPTKNLGLFTELGYGPVGRCSFGASYRIF
jgi:hypothetical protein